MSATTVDGVRPARLGPGQRVRFALHDAAILTRRNLLQYIRIPTLLVFSTVQPVMFVVLFRYVFGGAIQQSLPPTINYVSYLMPGIFVQTAIFGATQTGVGLATDLGRGIIDRFRSLPMARSAVLAGRTLADACRNLFVVLLMTIVGYFVGFRFEGGLFFAILAIALAVLVGFTFSWISACIGLALKKVEAVQAASFTWIFPVVFVSSAFVPVVPLLLCAPKYVAGELSLGQVMQSASAFVTVQIAFNWVVDNYPRLAEWTASGRRLGALLASLERLDRADVEDIGRITRTEVE